MVIDIILLLLLCLGIYLGYNGGVVRAFFALVALFLGAAVALKFTAMVSVWCYGHFEVQTEYLPFIVFIVLFVLVVVAIKGLGKLVESLMDALFLGWLNRAVGALLWCLLFFFLYSTFLWFADGSGLITDTVKAESKTYEYIYAAAPMMLDGLAHIIPWFKGMLDKILPLMKPAKDTATAIWY